jgi:hypothetical protein
MYMTSEKAFLLNCNSVYRSQLRMKKIARREPNDLKRSVHSMKSTIQTSEYNSCSRFLFSQTWSIMTADSSPSAD